MTRADLMLRAAWQDLDVDTSGNPCVWRNYYRDEAGNEWTDDWSCQCDDGGFSPYHSEWIGPEDPKEIALWEILYDR